MQLFTDGSMHPPSGIGYGAFLAVPDALADPETLKELVQLKRFEPTASSQLEIETLIWAIGTIPPQKITIFTDSQTIIGLPGRRADFEKQNYCTAKGKPHRHAALYQKFFNALKPFDFAFKKIKGHRPAKQKDIPDQLFTLVDRASRQALRAELAAL